MGDNIRDAALVGSPAPTAKRGWSELSSHAAAGGVLVNDYGTTCLRLKGNVLLIDRTDGFSEDEFRRMHREYAKFGLKDIWIVNARDFARLELRERLPENFMTMLHPNSRKSHFLIDGKKYTLAGGVTYLMTGELDTAHLLSGEHLISTPVHRGSYPKITVNDGQKQTV